MSMGSLWSVKQEFRLKVGLLALTFAFLTATQAVWRSLKNSVFAKVVGAAHLPTVRVYSIFLLIPIILFYSKLVDVLRRHQLLYVFTLIHAIGGLIFAFLLADSSTGIANTIPSPTRWVGWGFYLFMESFSAFLSTSFWSFANSVNKPREARTYYGLFVAGSKIGGILAASGMWLFMMIGTGKLNRLTSYFLEKSVHISDAILIPTLLSSGSLFLFGAAICTFLLMKLVPGYHLHGYEAVYQTEKKRDRMHEPFSLTTSLKKMVDGLWVIASIPYVLGIFSLSVFYDIINSIIDIIILVSADESTGSVGELTIFYASYFLTMHLCGFVVSMLITTPLQRVLSNRTMLLLFPTLCLLAVIVICFYSSPAILFFIGALLRGANYGLNHPTREMLYIPTTKEIKFKSKAWSDAFGTRMAKASASFFYKYVSTHAPSMGYIINNGFMLSITTLWITVSYFLGRTLQHALDHQQVIGSDGSAATQKAENPHATTDEEE